MKRSSARFRNSQENPAKRMNFGRDLPLPTIRERFDEDQAEEIEQPNAENVVEEQPIEPQNDEEIIDPPIFGPENNPETFEDENSQAQEERDEERGNQVEEEEEKMSTHVYIKPVDNLQLTGNIAENWKRFKRSFTIFMEAAQISTKADNIKISTFLNAIGSDAVEIFDTLPLTPIQKTQYDEVLKAFEDFCLPQKNTIYERYVFRNRMQNDGESFDSYLIELKRLIKTCEYAAVENEMLRDQIVMGVWDKRLKTKLLETKNLNYDTAVEKCRASEATREQSSAMNKTVAVSEVQAKPVNEITQNRMAQQSERSNNNNNIHTDRRHNANNAKNQHQRNNNNNTNTQAKRSFNPNTNNSNRSSMAKCKYCNYSHRPRECPAFGKQCMKCSKYNHFGSVCRTRPISTINAENNDNCSNNSEFYIGMIETVTADETGNALSNEYPWIEHILLNEKNVQMKIDTGAAVNVMPLSVLKRISPRIELRQTPITLRAFGGQKMKPLGMCSIHSVFNGVSSCVDYAVVDFEFTPILGLSTCIRFGIVKPFRTRTFYRSNHNNRNL